MSTAVKFSFFNPQKRPGLWRQAIEGKGQILLHFSPRFREGEKLETPMELRLIDAKKGADLTGEYDSCVIVNLTRLFSPLRS